MSPNAQLRPPVVDSDIHLVDEPAIAALHAVVLAFVLLSDRLNPLRPAARAFDLLSICNHSAGLPRSEIDDGPIGIRRLDRLFIRDVFFRTRIRLGFLDFIAGRAEDVALHLASEANVTVRELEELVSEAGERVHYRLRK
jgi:hypothetical protein